jgi:hypothetical protein
MHDSTQAKRIPSIDLRRIARFGMCSRPHPTSYRLQNQPCSSSSLRDDVHFAGCPQAQHSRSGICLEWR